MVYLQDHQLQVSQKIYNNMNNISCDLLKLVIPFLSVFRSDSKFCGVNNYYNGVAGCQLFRSFSLSLFALSSGFLCFCSSFNAYQSLRKTDRQSQETVCEQASVHEDVCVSCSHIKCMRNLYVRMWEREGQSVHACVYACLCKPSHAHAGAWERERERASAYMSPKLCT